MPTYSSSPSALLEAKSDGVQAVIDVAQAATAPRTLALGEYHVLALGDGKHQTIDLTGDQYRDTPKRKRGEITVRDATSFLDYFGKHSDDGSEIYADVEALRVTAVLDAHQADPGGARWGGHRLVLALRKTPSWLAWADKDGALLEQKAFAEFVEDNLVDIVAPSGATILEIAESFHATSKTAFTSGTRLANGDTKLAFSDETTAKAGRKGDITIPSVIKLGLRPFEGSDPYELTARFRYRLEKDELRLGFRLDRPADVLTAAFADVRTALAAAVVQPVLNGTPAR